MFEEVCLYRPVPGGGESKVMMGGHRRDGSRDMKGNGGNDGE
jgi:hypothetical protein